jgi:hypothetical protein
VTRLKWKVGSVHLEIVLIVTQDRCLCRAYHRLRNHVGRNRWNTEVTWLVWNLILVHLEAVSVLVQDRCMETIDLEIVSDAPDGTPR